MSKWSEYYMSRVGSGYSEYAKKRYAPMLDILVSSGSSFREEGCGIGTISKILLERSNVSLEAFDFDPDILELAKRNIATNIPLYHGDIRVGVDRPVDAIFSHGVIEHFSDEDIFHILKQQGRRSKRVVHYVPTDGYESPSFGDERLLPYRCWLEKFKPSDFILFNKNKDLLLIWEV